MDAEVNQQVHRLAYWLKERPYSGIGEAVPGYCVLFVHYDPAQLTYAQASSFLENALSDAGAAPLPQSRCIEIPTIYGGAAGPDLEEVARQHLMTTAEVVRLHSGRTYRVYLIGFTPGFAYLGELDPALAIARRLTPRTHVPVGSVGLAGNQTGVYPSVSPGGWWLIGRTTLCLFDINHNPPALLQPGDRVIFVPVGATISA